MKLSALEKRIQAKREAQDKLAAELALLKREQAAVKKAAREKLERAIGRLALRCGLGDYGLDVLEPAFRTLAMTLEADADLDAEKAGVMGEIEAHNMGVPAT